MLDSLTAGSPYLRLPWTGKNDVAWVRVLDSKANGKKLFFPPAFATLDSRFDHVVKARETWKREGFFEDF